ncbi:hypothetical protein [Mesorhizobium sp. M1396]|uniref:hypothetical protein n=1 Tax=Mesorhizobium sp. M1396 TaxID=2957095 RepID=UPI00333DFE72
MALTEFPSLGVLTFEGGPAGGHTPWPSGTLLNPATFEFPMIWETVSGSRPEAVIRGDRALESPCIEAARRLVERGAKAITADCGFFIRHQEAVAAAVNVPVAMSSLLLVPTLLRQLPPAAKLAIVTADSTHCDINLLGINEPADRERVVIGGGFSSSTLHRMEVMLASHPTKTDIAACVADMETDLSACITRLRDSHPDVAAVLFECTAFPMVTPAIRRKTKLPIYDITTLCRLTFGSVV